MVILTKNIVVFFNLIIFRLYFVDRHLARKVSDGHKRNTSSIPLGKKMDCLTLNNIKAIGAVSSILDVILLTPSISKLQPCAYFELLSTGAE